MWDGFISELKKRRPTVKVVGELFVPMTEKDYTNYISILLDAKPDLVHSVMWSGAGVAFVQQAKPYGFFDKTKFYLSAASIGTTMTSLGENMVPMWGSEPANWEDENPMMKRLVNDFMGKTGKPPHSYVAHSYGTIMILKQAIEKAKSTDTMKVVEALEGGIFDTPWGESLLRKGDHQAMGKVFIGKAKPHSRYPFWSLQDLKVIPCEEVSLDVSMTGCILK
jgi:branched-chain amino acid transport system substrate-binding protein